MFYNLQNNCMLSLQDFKKQEVDNKWENFIFSSTKLWWKNIDEKLPRTVSLTIPTDTRAAFALIINSSMVSGFSDKHPGGTTGKSSWKLNLSYFPTISSLFSYFFFILLYYANLKCSQITLSEEDYKNLLHYSFIHHHQGLLPKSTIIIISTQGWSCPGKHKKGEWNTINRG